MLSSLIIHGFIVHTLVKIRKQINKKVKRKLLLLESAQRGQEIGGVSPDNLGNAGAGSISVGVSFQTLLVSSLGAVTDRISSALKYLQTY